MFKCKFCNASIVVRPILSGLEWPVCELWVCLAIIIGFASLLWVREYRRLHTQSERCRLVSQSTSTTTQWRWIQAGIWNDMERCEHISSHFDLMRIFSFGKLVRFSSIFFFQLFINVHLSRWPGYVCACVSVECVWLRVLDQWNAITKAKQNASMCRNAQCALHTFIMILVVTRLAAGQPMPIARAHANEREMARRRRRTATFSCTCNLCTCDCYHSKRMKWNENRQRSIHTRPAKYRAKMDFIRKHVAHRTPTKR